MGPENPIVASSQRKREHSYRSSLHRIARRAALSAPTGTATVAAMRAVLIAVVTSVARVLRSRLGLQIEVLALRQQLALYQRAERQPRLPPADRLLWAWLSRTRTTG